MSAIAGIYQLQDEPIDTESGRRMMHALQQYPADRVQSWHNEKIFFGCHAQWITPESVNETLPFYDRERGLSITADAMIDNRAELFDRLNVIREDRQTMPDSLLILLAYEKWGQDTPRHLMGIFAFMIWDEKNRILFGARDFSGSRTLYYYRNSSLIAFCTTIGPLFTLPGVDKQPNEQWISEFLAIPITTDAVDSYSTVYKNIEQVPPSHSFTIVDEKISFSQYCSITPESNKLRLKSNAEYEEAFREVFDTAVNGCIRTHHQVGSQLSGGLDSSAIVSFAARSLERENKRLHTFSYYPADDFEDFTSSINRTADERPFIQATVNHVGNLSTNYLNFPGKSPLSEVNDWLDLLEMPYKYFENSFWIKGIYEEAQKSGIGVMLNGQRGNWSVSWGPGMDYQARLIRQFRWIKFAREYWLYCNNLGALKGSVLSVVSGKAFPFLAKLLPIKASRTLPPLISPQFSERTGVIATLERNGLHTWGSSLQSAYDVRDDLYKQLFYWNINGTNGTRLSLKYGVLDRDPTNDLRVIRFCLSLPDDQFVQDGMDRYLIRRSTEGYLPNKVRFSRRNRGVQGADGVHRMLPVWSSFIDELQQMIAGPYASYYLNTKQLADSLEKIRHDPRSDIAFDFDLRLLMRALIFCRFMQRTFEGR